VAEKKPVYTVTSRSVLGRRGKTYDAQTEAFGEKFHSNANSRKLAIEILRRDVEYMRLSEALTHENGFSLCPQGFESWVLMFPHGGSYVFTAANVTAAAEHLDREYPDHEEIQTLLNDSIKVAAPVLIQSRRERKKAQG